MPNAIIAIAITVTTVTVTRMTPKRIASAPTARPPAIPPRLVSTEMEMPLRSEKPSSVVSLVAQLRMK